MKIPDGVRLKKVFIESHVCLVKKALYGLKVSPKKWYLRFSEAMTKMGFNVYSLQACLYYWRKQDQFVLVLLYVDDILLTGNCKDKINETKRRISQEFKMKHLGEPKRFLGIEIERDRRKGALYLSQRDLIQSVIRKFKLKQAATCKTPARTNQASNKSVNEVKVETRLDLSSKIPYREAVGVLLYIANCTRPDISVAVNMLCRKQSDYTLNDWVDVERVIKYLNASCELRLVFHGKADSLIGFSDASLGLNDPQGKSTTGYVIKLFGDTVSWGSKKQDTVATSSMEAEYIAMSKTAKILTYLSELRYMMLRERKVPTLYEDNTAAIAAAKSEVSKTLKHLVKLHYHYI